MVPITFFAPFSVDIPLFFSHEKTLKIVSHLQMNKTGEPELICIDSDDDGTPPPAAVPSANLQSVSVLITGGQAIDVTKLRTPRLDQIVRPIQLPAFTYVSRPPPTGSRFEIWKFAKNTLPRSTALQLSQSTRPRGRPPTNSSTVRTKQHEFINQIVEVQKNFWTKCKKNLQTAPLGRPKRAIAQVLAANENLPGTNNFRLAQASL